MRKVGIVGVGQLPFKSRYVDKTYRALAFEATKRALSDAGLRVADVDAVVYAIFNEIMMRQQMGELYLHDYLGMAGKPCLRVSAGGATGGHALRVAFGQIASGLSDIVLVLGIQKGNDFYHFGKQQRSEALLQAAGMTYDTVWHDQIMPGVPPLYALILNGHIERYGGPTLEQMAKVCVKNHRNALANPNAELKLELTVEQVLNARIIAWPVTLYQCCLYSEGAAAVILAAEGVAQELTDEPIWITGIGSRDYPTYRFQPETWGRMVCIQESAKEAYAMAGVENPRRDLDVIELYDLVSGLEILAYEELGLCGLGEGGRLVDEGMTEKRGDLPVNPSGGQTACGHVAGVSEISAVCDVTRQLREEAGPIQVPIRKGRGMVQDVCGTASLADVIILER